MVILDTDTVIYFLNGVHSVVEHARLHGLHHLAVASPTMGELYFGAYRSHHVQKNLKRVDDLAESIILLPLDQDTLRCFGELKAQLLQQGHPVGDMDTLIAATAVVHDAMLVTHNVKHFRAFRNLKLDDWYRDE